MMWLKIKCIMASEKSNIYAKRCSECGPWSCMQMNVGKVVILLEIDPGTELSVSLTLFNVTHCGLAAVRTRSNNETQKSETGQERDCIQLLIKTFSSVTHMSGLFCLSNCVRGVYLVLKMRVFFCGFVTPGHIS